jgi:hypothetical protein
MMKRPLDHSLSAWPWSALLTAVAALLAWQQGGALRAQEASPKAVADSKTQAPVVEPEAAEVASPLTAFGRQIPAMRPNRGIWIPSFANGVRSSLVEADVMTRLDDSRLEAENMTINLFGAEAKDDVEISLPRAIYHMTHQILRSDERSKVSRADFDLEGDSLIFDTTTSQGRMTGNVRMTIHDSRGFLENLNSQNAADSTDPKGEVTPTSADAVAPVTSTTTSSSRKSSATPAAAQKP